MGIQGEAILIAGSWRPDTGMLTCSEVEEAIAVLEDLLASRSSFCRGVSRRHADVRLARNPGQSKPGLSKRSAVFGSILTWTNGLLGQASTGGRFGTRSI